MTNLEIHHQQFRSHSGPDHEDNLLTRCNSCHSAVHKQVRTAITFFSPYEPLFKCEKRKLWNFGLHLIRKGAQ